jgi:hypothetical protein
VITTQISGAPCAHPTDRPAPLAHSAHLTPSQALRRDLLAVRWAVLSPMILNRLWLILAAHLSPYGDVAWFARIAPALALVVILITTLPNYILLSLHADATAESAGGPDADQQPTH